MSTISFHQISKFIEKYSSGTAVRCPPWRTKTERFFSSSHSYIYISLLKALTKLKLFDFQVFVVVDQYEHLVGFGYVSYFFASSWIDCFKCFATFCVYKFVIDEQLLALENKNY